MKPLIFGDRVRLKSTGELYFVEGLAKVEGTDFILISKTGHMPGGVAINDNIPVRRDEVELMRMRVEWEVDE